MLSVLRTAVKGSLRVPLTVVSCFEPLHQINISFPSFKSTDDNRCRAVEVGCGNMRGSKFDTRKLWWRLAAVLTCKSIVKFGYRGERLIEPIKETSYTVVE